MRFIALPRCAILSFLFAASCGVLLVSTQARGQAGTLSVNAQDVRYVVFHRPGPAWKAGGNMFAQPGVRAHVAHYRQWLASGKLELGGPHLDDAGGGMMIPVAGVTEDEVKRFASEDPAVKDGTLLFQVRPWLIGMRK